MNIADVKQTKLQAKVRKALPNVNKIPNGAWEKKGGVAGTSACSAGCQQTWHCQ